MKRFLSFFQLKSSKNMLLCTLLLFLFTIHLTPTILQATELMTFPNETIPFSTEEIASDSEADVSTTTEIPETTTTEAPILIETPAIETSKEDFIVEDFNGIYYVTSSGGLNVRSGPSIQYDIIGNLPYGDQISVTGKVQNDWFEIIFQKTYGYISAKYLSVEQPSTLTAETEEITETLENIFEEPVPEQENVPFVSDTTMMLLLFAIVTMIIIIIITVISFFHNNHKYS